MKSKAISIALVFFGMVFIGCTTDDETAEDKTCRISTITSDEFIFKFNYNVDGNLFFINQDFLQLDTDPIALNLYVRAIGQDSIIYGRFTNSFTADTPRLTTKYEDEVLTTVKRLSASGILLSTMHFEYGESTTRILLEPEDGNPDVYGDYFFDGDENVIRVEKYVYDEEGEEATLFEVVDYTYDSFNNPWKGQVYPLLFCTDLPNAKYFSSNNALTEIVGAETMTFNYSYDTDNKTVMGDVAIFNTCSTSNVAANETYGYIDCDD
ncbi:hypothetical protein FGM00_11970 [Aggregatimonas sangjinii]|uniref:DUF4595 domain-containing protein n=1 Tax=Aggregatimonas sangjinii TaxID=2583587 RepID=A0A5B7SVC4_9FLAO|nr:hypothetical protein [Aggregatimonas sangjinii]QCX00790.1 hypothetical protein FGM00_11970 [Aggregatimonas sangjinii]